ncbi:transcriptional regulator, Crp/Fnr family [Candidatus Koribacter versatilis Ellin345]|uniref:Transcriptional regulator, Crp/Fnr family n=1 Tax=Koribacter versatilis (strain Ellin345) TaxID=204669 RepID=Q1IVN0_KORVE|nr:Crp/Fnr family transcriptional regulator [Candidatus Koribacter versatilis]ABF39070.1 transcriptional regulator, Crp/Fnr family [Candidatus Koribacter versatilis Ellin345]
MAIRRSVSTTNKRPRRLSSPATALATAASRRKLVVPKRRAPAVPTDPAFDAHTLLDRLGSGSSGKEFQRNGSLFAQGDLADAVFYIQSGKIKLTVVSKRGKEAVVAILAEGSFFGEGCLAGQPLRMSTASSLQRSTLIRVEKLVMLNLLHKDKVFGERFLAYVLSRNIRMEADLVDQLFNSSEKRLARLLLLLANFGNESKPIPVIAKMSQETLAEMIGTTRSRVSYFLNRFRELGFIDYNGGGMSIHSSLMSVVLHD